MGNKLQLLDVEEFIKRTKAKPVTSDKTFESKRDKKLHPEGVYSEEIFGLIGSRQRRKKYGYIPFPFKVFAPIFFDELGGGLVSGFFSRSVYSAIQNGAPFYLMSDGSFSTKPENLEKNTYAIKKFETVNDIYNFLKNEQHSNEFNLLRKYQEEHNGKEFFNFFINNLDRIFVDKIIVIPAAYRDIFIKDNVVKENTISKLYQTLVRLSNLAKDKLSKSKQVSDLGAFAELQKKSEEDEEFNYERWARAFFDTLHSLTTELINILGFGQKGKLIRGAKLSKRLDHTVRLVLGHDNNLKPTEVKIPWMFVNKLYEEFILHHILNNPEYSDIKDWVVEIAGTDKIDKNVFREVTNKIIQNPQIVPETIKEKFIKLQNEIIEGKYDGVEKYVIVIRHPVESSDSILASKPVVNPENSYTSELPQTVFSTLGADVDGDQINIYAVFTPRANKELKEKLSFNNPSSLQSVTKYGSSRVSIDMDLALSIYELVK